MYGLVLVIKLNPNHNNSTPLIANYPFMIFRIHSCNLGLVIDTRPARSRSHRLEQMASSEVDRQIRN